MRFVCGVREQSFIKAADARLGHGGPSTLRFENERGAQANWWYRHSSRFYALPL
jgi:hypothetical protein